MKKQNVVMFWLPRAMNIAFILAAVYYEVRLYIFLHSFKSYEGIIQGFLLTLIPILLFLLILRFSWKRSWLGATAFIILALVYVIFASININTKLIIAGLLFLEGLLYTIEWLLNKHKIGEIPAFKSTV